MKSNTAEEMREDREENSFYQRYTNRKNKLLRGKVWIYNGKLYVNDGQPIIPTIVIEEDRKGIFITKNGEIVTDDEVEVTEKDILSIEVEDHILSPRCTIITDDERLTAFVDIEPGYYIARKIKTIFPTHKAILSVVEQREINALVSVEEIKQKLREASVNFGIKEEAILLAAQSTKQTLIEVAKGISPEIGRNGFLELKVDSSIKHTLNMDEKGDIDFRESHQIPMVESGDTLAIVHPPTLSKSGMSVLNNEILATPAMAIKLHLEKGVTIEEDRIVATKVGRPYIHQKDHQVKATVIPKFLQKENVSIATGNIHFYGDVEVIGEVEENMIVEAGNDITLHDSVTNSTITAAHSIVCSGNIANSILSAGEKDAVLMHLVKSIGKITEQLELLIVFVQQITHSPTYQNSEPKQSIRSIVDFLLKKRFLDFKDQAKQFILQVDDNKNSLPQEWKDRVRKLQEVFFTHSYLETTVAELQIVWNLLREIYENSMLEDDEESTISVANTINSTLRCNGDIHIIGHGSLNTEIEAQGKVMIKGLLRGGCIFAKEGAEIREVGSAGGVKTSISVPIDKVIMIGRAHEGTELQIGSVKLTLNKLHQNVVAHLNPEGNIVLK